MAFHLSDSTRLCEMTQSAKNLDSGHLPTPCRLKYEALSNRIFSLLSTKPGIIMDQYQDSKINYFTGFQLLFSSRAHSGLLS